MKLKYFSDTDTAHVEFNNRKVFETKEVSDSIYIDVGRKGNIVNMTIKHAKVNAGLSEFSFQEIKKLHKYN